MTIENYNPTEHEHILELLLNLRNCPIDWAQSVPYSGYVISHNGTPAAIGFLRCMEGAMALLDSAVTNPELSSAVRHEAYDLLISSLITLAAEQGIYKIMVFSVDDGTIQRARRHGFQLSNQSLLIREL